ncbi:MAG: hypothetical protein Q9207_002620 [Kuettlingeria erythrocarpa]
MSQPVQSTIEAKAANTHHLMETPHPSVVDACPTKPSDEPKAMHREANQSSTHTNSMVTIRLSDCTIISSEEFSTEDTLAEAPIDEDATGDMPHQANPDSSNFTSTAPSEESNAGADILEAEVKLFQRAHRMSTISMPSIAEEGVQVRRTGSIRSRSDSSGTLSSNESTHVDWDSLDKSEEAAPRDEGSDESTAFLLARLEQENDALATDPKAARLKKLVDEPAKPSYRYSVLLDPPPMTELEFWAALVSNYPQTAQRLPTLTSNKIRNGVPPPLRGVVWTSIAGARDQLLEDEYDRLCTETSPYENLIGKDIGRSFPNVEMFKDPAGEGQKMLAKVLGSFSIYDQKIGYCQGLGFVVGPLLMHMADKDAFCVLVRYDEHLDTQWTSLIVGRLMEHYDLRSCFLPDLSGLHLRIYQFQELLKRHLPTLTVHLETLQVEPLYVSQWFLSFFAVTCPLPMLLRIYDVILTEGASETLMRVALSLMRRNDKKIKACTEFEDVMHLLLSRELWDTYNCNADELVNDFVGLTGLVTRESLEALEKSFKDSPNGASASKVGSASSVQAAASGFLGRFWAGSSSASKASPTSSLGVAASTRPSSFLRRTPSKQSMASTLNSIETIDSTATKASTEATTMSRNPSADCTNKKIKQPSTSTPPSALSPSHPDKDLHSQIEDLLTALSDMQREHNILADELQREREEREDDRAVVCRFIDQSRTSGTPQPSKNLHIDLDEQTETVSYAAGVARTDTENVILAELEGRFEASATRRSSILQTKQGLLEDIKSWKVQYELEATRSVDLARQLADQEAENIRVLEQFREVRSRMQESQKDKQKLEKTIEELKGRRGSNVDSPADVYTPVELLDGRSMTPGGLRDFKLGRTGSVPSLSAPTPAFSKRSSSLGLQAVLATEDHKPLADEALLLELVNAKTAEAVARQELEEVKSKLDSLKRIVGGTITSPVMSGHRPSPSEPCVVRDTSSNSVPSSQSPAARTGQGASKVATPASSGGGFFGWGKRTISNAQGESPGAVR